MSVFYISTGQLLQMTNLSDGNASHNLSAVVTFKSRDLVMPKGVDGGEALAWASADELLALHVELASDAKVFWKDGFLLYTLWAMGDFCGMVPPERRSSHYPYTRTGFYQFLRDHGSQISHEEASRRIKVFRAYNRFGVTIIRMVKRRASIKRLPPFHISRRIRSGTCCSCALRRRITACGAHCSEHIPNLVTVTGAAGPRRNYAGRLSAVQCSAGDS